jgi:hypothetical protein
MASGHRRRQPRPPQRASALTLSRGDPLTKVVEFPSDHCEEGIAVTRAIWRDMPGFDGYLAHEIVEDLDQPGHLIVVSR